MGIEAVVRSWLDDATTGRAWTAGAQVWAAAGDEVVDLAAGRSPFLGPLDASVLHGVWCVAKPVVALAVLAALERDGLDVATPVPWAAVPGGVPVGDLLCHRAGLVHPSAMELRMTPYARREALLAAAGPGVGPGYSEVLGGWLLEHFLEECAGQPVHLAIADLVTGPLGVADELRFHVADDEVAAIRARHGVVVERTDAGDVPFAGELRTPEIQAVRPALGALSSARALGVVMRAWVRLLRGEPVAGLRWPTPELVADAVARASCIVDDDVALGSRMSFGPGYMTNRYGELSAHLSPDGIGQLGLRGSAFVLAEPADDLVVVVVANGLATVPELMAQRRDELVDGLRGSVPVGAA